MLNNRFHIISLNLEFHSASFKLKFMNNDLYIHELRNLEPMHALKREKENNFAHNQDLQHFLHFIFMNNQNMWMLISPMLRNYSLCIHLHALYIIP